MTAEDKNVKIFDDYAEVINSNSIVKHFSKGMSRFLILWIIKYHGPIHGYEILKELDKFFLVFIEDKAIKRPYPSNIYPILNNMESHGFIVSEVKMKNNKKIKYFDITDEGVKVLNYVYTRFKEIQKNSQWQLLFEDMD